MVSYYGIYFDIAKEEVLAATIWNFVLIIVILVLEKIELLIVAKANKKLDSNKITFASRIRTVFYSFTAPFKSALYFFYIGLLVCHAIVIADPSFPVLGEMSDYFASVYGGLLVLLAAEMFLKQAKRDLAK
jgi:hypothetical protein